MFQRLGRRERGQTLIEFAFIAPIIFLFLFTIVDFGLAMDRRITLQHAVREGARYGAVHIGCDDIRDRTAAQAQSIISRDDVTVSYTDSTGTPTNPASTDDSVGVKAHFTYKPAIVNSISKVFGATALDIDMSPSASARLEQTVTDAGGCGP